MTNLRDKTVIVTGAASGIGLALAEFALGAGSNVMLSDISADALAREGARLAQIFPGHVATCVVNVAHAEDVQQLAEKTNERFGSTDILINNAGIFAVAKCWEMPIADYDRLIDVNVRGVLHGIRTFVPLMLAQKTPCHVINLASAASVIVSPDLGAYCLTKHAVLAISEALHLDLQTQGYDQIGVTIAMPGLIQTHIIHSAIAARAPATSDARIDAIHAAMESGVDAGMPAHEAARLIFEAVANGKLYVRPNFSGEREQLFANGVANGRTTDEDPYRQVIEAYRDKARN